MATNQQLINCFYGEYIYSTYVMRDKCLRTLLKLRCIDLILQDRGYQK